MLSWEEVEKGPGQKQGDQLEAVEKSQVKDSGDLGAVVREIKFQVCWRVRGDIWEEDNSHGWHQNFFLGTKLLLDEHY